MELFSGRVLGAKYVEWGGWSQAVDGTMGVHMPCPYTLAGSPLAFNASPALPSPAVGARWVGARERQMEVVGKLGHPCRLVAPVQPRPPLKAPSGTTPGDSSLHCRGSVGAAVSSALHYRDERHTM